MNILLSASSILCKQLKTYYENRDNLNHLAIKRGFEEGDILPKKTMKNVAALIVFPQPITLINLFSQKTQSWLHA